MKVYVKTPARLHMGLIDLKGNLGRIFGGLGVGIDRPNFIIEAEESDALNIEGKGAYTALAETIVRRFSATYKVPENVFIRVRRTIPEHVGLGSGTQLSLAIATALAKIFKLNTSVWELASAMGRGKRTWVGTAIFSKGGLIIDCGKSLKKENSPVEGFPKAVLRFPFPSDWPFVVAIPNVGEGLSGNVEEEAFRSISASEEKIDRTCRIILVKLIPALLERDIWEFGEALTTIQTIVGSQFVSVQGGVFSNEVAAEGIRLMQNLGACGAGQSSWGPTFYGLFDSLKKAEETKKAVQSFLMERGCGGRVFIAHANNRGAYIRIYREKGCGGKA
jgi:beta-RFAP synthase